MSTELLVPFGLSHGGQIATTIDPNTQAQQHVNSLISTTPGERAMQPTYGIDLTGQIFAPEADLSAHVVTEVEQAFATWEPHIQLNNVKPVQLQSGDLLSGQTTLNVEWSIPGQTMATTRTGISQATILIGGSVVIDQQVTS